MSIASEITRIQGAKSSMKSAIESKGVSVGNITIDGYAAKIADIPSGDIDGANGIYSIESKTIATSASTTKNISYNKKIGIIDENNVLWDVLDWHNRWVTNGYSKTGLSEPIGIWMDDAFGNNVRFLWPIMFSKRYDVTGSGSYSEVSIRHSLPAENVPKSAGQGNYYPAVGNIDKSLSGRAANTYYDEGWTAAINGDGLDIYVSNTKETFHLISRNVAKTSRLSNVDADDYMDAVYVHNELLRAMSAICTGVQTNESNGTLTTVNILNNTGQQPAVGEDMYFWVNGTNTGILAKYNLWSQFFGTSYALTQAIADALYAKQINNGINMNDTGVNSDTKKIIYEGSKGAEAIAVEGYWYIKTPIISGGNANGTTGYNLPDSPAVYSCRKKNVVIPTARDLIAFYLNSNYQIASILDILKNVEGYVITMPSYNNLFWTSEFANGSFFWAVNLASGDQIERSSSYWTGAILPKAKATTLFTKH